MESINTPSPSKNFNNPRGNSARTQKPKQTKSRNGCVTCKAKRLKCDEIKPSCQQCERRKVKCGGYKKDFKWRAFEETNLTTGRPTVKPKKAASSQPPSTDALPTPPTTDQFSTPIRKPQAYAPRSPSGSPLQGSPISITSFPSEVHSLDELPGNQEEFSMGDSSTPQLNVNVSLSADSPPLNFLSFLEPFQDSLSLNSLASDANPITGKQSPFSPDGLSGGSPEFSFSRLLEDEHDDIEDIIRRSDPGLGPWNLNLSDVDAFNFQDCNIPGSPSLPLGSPEMLVLRYDKLTCGILSVKDGALENPWRTLVWPQAKDTPALRHAIFALAAFHSGKETPYLRVQGMKHMRQSTRMLAENIGTMRADTALATSLALAFADTWGQRTRTCIQHLRDAKTLMSQVIATGMQASASDEELDRIRFLYNTWSYMDVIARLTSLDDCGLHNWDSSVFDIPHNTVHNIDPLMGCATTLYPLMSRVAKLIQHVRKTVSNTVSVVAQAMELKALLEQWEPPHWFEPPQDPHSEVQHSIQVAHAYRWAILLYLHQAVPEIPSQQADELAKRVLILLATVPYTSRTTIIQMFPLVAAGAEVDSDDDRKWVLERWTTIQARLMLGGVDRYLEVLKEVWARRDAMNARRENEMNSRRAGSAPSDRGRASSSLPSNFGSFSLNAFHKSVAGRGQSRHVRRGSALASLENIEFERTVRGKLHWVNVMAEWGWDVFVGY